MPTAKLRPDHFEHAVQSVLHQSMKEIELIIVLQNDPKEHPAYDIAKRDERVIVGNVDAPYGEHFPKAYNHGIDLAISGMICFAHDDDVQLKDKAEIMYNCLNNRPDTGMVHAGWLVADKDLEIQSMTWGIKDLTYEEYKHYGSFSPNAAIIRKSVFKTVKFNENYHRVHEFIWCLECMEAGFKLYNMRIPVFIQRIHNSFSRFSGVKEKEFAEYERYREERGDQTIAWKKQDYWEHELPRLRQQNFNI